MQHERLIDVHCADWIAIERRYHGHDTDDWLSHNWNDGAHEFARIQFNGADIASIASKCVNCADMVDWSERRCVDLPSSSTYPILYRRRDCLIEVDEFP